MADTAYISGWFESEEGAVQFEYEDMPDYESLAFRLYIDFGDDCAGVDLELEGEYEDGTDVSSQLIELLEDLDFLCN